MRKAFLILIFGCFIASNASIPSHDFIIKDRIQAIFKDKGYVPDFILTNTVKSSGDVTIYYGKQVINTIPIYKTEFILSIKNNVIISLHHNFIVNAEDYVNSYAYNLSPEDALKRITSKASENKALTSTQDKHIFEIIDQNISDRPIIISKLWVLLQNSCYPAYNVSLYDKDHLHWYNTRINGITGQIIDKNDWVTHCNLHNKGHFDSRNNLLNNSPLLPQLNTAAKTTAFASYNVFAYPIESPNHGNRSIVSSPDNPDASPFGWHDTNGSAGEEYTITRGNNVYASEDKNDLDVPGYSPDGGSTLTFDFSFDQSQSPTLFLDAAVTNLFYWNNLMHDVWWHYGFDEESGNFQSNNYGNGGLSGDYVQADAQDGSGTNNANFATPPDGDNPRMQMYIWNTSNTANYFEVLNPSSLKGKYNAGTASFGPALSPIPVSGKLVLVNDGTTNGDQGCSTIINSSEVSGNIALIRRKGCNFSVKVKNAQDAGAIAAVIFSDDENPIQMGGANNGVTIPSVHITQSLGISLSNAQAGQNVSVSLYDSNNVAAAIMDSDFDNGVIAHEYGHGISNRLTGGAANSSCLTNEEQMGEGWSDFFSLVMTHQPNDSANKMRGIGTYVRNTPPDGNGIRTYPYSADISRSPYSYDDIKTLSIPHGVGSVWCSMLWDLYWSMIDKYGFDSDIYNGTGGNNMAMQLVIDGLKLQPCNPGFTDGRDAILQADQNTNGGENELLIWSVFSRRGLGYSADQGSADDRSDGIEAFDIPPYLIKNLQITKTAAEMAINGQNLKYSILAVNKTPNTIKNIEIKDTLSTNVNLVASTLACGTVSDRVLTLVIDSIVSGDSFSCTFEVVPNFSRVTSTIWGDQVSASIGSWEVSRSGDVGSWEIINLTATNAAWKAKNEEVATDLYLSHDFDLTQAVSPLLSFSHWMNSESGWDGGVIELKVGQLGWIDAGPYLIKNGYNSVVQTNPNSAISGRDAFTGNSGGFINTKLDLSAYAGQIVSVRFRFASDAAVAEDGWYIDSFKLIDVVSLKNTIVARYANELDKATALTYIYNTLEASVKNPVISSLTIFPNPTENMVFIKADVKDELNYTVCDIHGKLLIEKSTIGEAEIKLNSLSSGVYILNIQVNGESSVHKIIKR